jgi:hypothetical protein
LRVCGRRRSPSLSGLGSEASHSAPALTLCACLHRALELLRTQHTVPCLVVQSKEEAKLLVPRALSHAVELCATESRRWHTQIASRTPSPRTVEQPTGVDATIGGEELDQLARQRRGLVDVRQQRQELRVTL